MRIGCFPGILIILLLELFEQRNKLFVVAFCGFELIAQLFCLSFLLLLLRLVQFLTGRHIHSQQKDMVCVYISVFFQIRDSLLIRYFFAILSVSKRKNILNQILGVHELFKCIQRHIPLFFEILCKILFCGALAANRSGISNEGFVDRLPDLVRKFDSVFAAVACDGIHVLNILFGI